MRTEELSERSVGDLVQQLSEQTATLVRKEMRLAQVELQEKGKRAGARGGVFCGARVARYCGVACATRQEAGRSSHASQARARYSKRAARRGARKGASAPMTDRPTEEQERELMQT